MSKRGLILLLILGVIAFLAFLAPGNYNQLVDLRENVNEQWGKLQSVYQRRADLIPNVVSTVKGYADFEQQTLENVTAARAKVSQITITKEILEDPALMARFTEAQNQLSQTLSRFLQVVESYPDLKANTGFNALIVELEGSENRISVERMKYNEKVRDYNARVKKFPTNLYAGIFGFHSMAYFEAQEGSENAPKVEF
jgi:LemA protein